MAFPYQVRSRMTLRLRVLFCILFVKNLVAVVCRRKMEDRKKKLDK
jgi:hypothetical protein